MSTSIAELLPSIAALSHADKFRLVQLILVQLAQEDGIAVEETQQSAAPFEPRTFFGVTHQPKQAMPPATPKKSLRGCLSRYAKPDLIAQEQDVWQTVVSEKHERR